MKQRKIILLIVLILIIVLFASRGLYSRLGRDIAPDLMAAQQQDAASVPAPDFLVYDPAGNEVRLSDYIGQPVVLNFWAGWCGPCRMEMPHFEQACSTVGDEVCFLMVNIKSSRETWSDAAAFIAQQGYTFPIYYDADSSAVNAYHVRSYPTTYFIDAEGFVRAQAVGMLEAETLQLGLDIILGP